MFDKITEKIDDILSAAFVLIRGDFNIDDEELLIHSNKTDKERRYFSIAYEITLWIGLPVFLT